MITSVNIRVFIIYMKPQQIHDPLCGGKLGQLFDSNHHRVILPSVNVNVSLIPGVKTIINSL